MSFDTIFALASAPGRGGVAVFRVSGPSAAKAITALTDEELPSPRIARLVTFIDPVTTDKIDKGLVLWFPGPNSFTGEDVAEFHPHGGRAVCDAMLRAFAALPGCRLAEPGEFTRRAFEHGKLDLTEAEAIADLVDAETEAQRRQAVRQLEGELGRIYRRWSDTLVKCVAHLEAYLDFPDEPLPPELEAAHQSTVATLIEEISLHLNDAGRGQRLRDGIRVAIVGAPNAGKSSLLNILSARDAAIVSATPGTTRDVVEVALNFGGFPVVLQDTAGLRETTDTIEAEGVKRAAARAEDADIRLAVFDGTMVPDKETLGLIGEKTIVVANKSDLWQGDAGAQKLYATANDDVIGVSTTTGAGMDDLRGALLALIGDIFGYRAEPSLTRARHRAALDGALAALQRSQTAPSLELVAEDLRMALRQIGAITGAVDVESLLDIIFSDFCIGK